MRLFYRAKVAKRTGETVYEQTGPVTFCCVEMSRRWGTLLGFGARDGRASTSREVNLFIDRPQVGGRAVLEVVPVTCCPFCGEAIEACRRK